MSTFTKDKDGRVREIELLDLFPANEGLIEQIYGKVRQGKNYLATRNILYRLKHGSVEYANWKISWDGYDQRESWFYTLLGAVGLKKRFYKFGKENFHFLPIDEDFLDTFERLTDCTVNLDEGQVIFDSYEHAKMSIRKRQSILATGHFGRTIIIISQRPTAIHVTARGNVNIFYKVEKLLSWPFLLFRCTEFQEMTGETVDEEKPERSRLYIGVPSVYKSYDTHYLRNGIQDSQRVHFEAYDVNYSRRLGLFSKSISALIPEVRLPSGFSRRRPLYKVLPPLDKQVLNLKQPPLT
jgi:hypothetical protein